MLGGLVLALVLVVTMTSKSPSDITDWAWDVLGVTFSSLLGALVFLCIFCWVRVNQLAGQAASAPWYAAGIQTANGVATLALTYTLLGISLGIGSLADRTLSPETVQDIIRELTENFSMAFMTTVIGLPLSALLRGLMVVTGARFESHAINTPEPRKPEFGELR